MRIGIPAEIKDIKGPVSNNFGRTQYYFIYDDSSEHFEFILNSAAQSQGGAGVKAAQTVVDSKADVLITPQLGENAAAVLKAAKIVIYKCEEGSLLDNIKLLKDGQLSLLSDIHQGYHGH